MKRTATDAFYSSQAEALNNDYIPQGHNNEMKFTNLNTF